MLVRANDRLIAASGYDQVSSACSTLGSLDKDKNRLTLREPCVSKARQHACREWHEST